MLNASVYTRQKCLLHGWFNKIVAGEVVGEPTIDEEMEGLPNAAAECNHSKIGWV